MASNLPGTKRAHDIGLNKRGNRSIGEGIIGVLLLLCALISVVTTVAVVYSIADETIQFFREVSVLEFFTSRVWTPLFCQ